MEVFPLHYDEEQRIGLSDRRPTDRRPTDRRFRLAMMGLTLLQKLAVC